MAVEQINQQASPQQASSRGTSFPTYALADSMEVPRAIHIKGGGQATPDQLAAHLGYKGINNGAYISRVAAARAFGMINKVGPVFVPTQLAHSILSPVYPHDAKKALVDAFLSVELFRKIYEDFRGKELPPEFGMLNALRNQYGVAPSRVKEAYRMLMDSAETAGFFETKAGLRTHLIMPLVQPVPGMGTSAQATADAATGGGSGGGASGGGASGGGTSGGGASGGGDQAQSATAQSSGTGSTSSAPKDAYLNLLVRHLEKKLDDGQFDEQLAQRIERLLGLTAEKK